jgi:RNA polymerase sigma factor (sigma-70 family)
MVMNADISWWRKVGRREHAVAEVFHRPGATTNADAADPATTITEVDAMWRLCAHLPRGQRAAVVLRYYEGLPDAEIAAILGCAESTVRSQIHRALASLRAHLFDQEHHHD